MGLFNTPQVKLETLIVAGNLLTYLPETVTSLKNLKELDAHQNHIKVFPRSILKLPKLDMVNMSRNKLEQLDGDFSEFSATELNVNQNQAGLATDYVVGTHEMAYKQHALPITGLAHVMLAGYLGSSPPSHAQLAGRVDHRSAHHLAQ